MSIAMPVQIRDAIVAHARFTAPEEACGLLASDRDGRIRMAYCLTNRDRSARRFTVDPLEHFKAMRHAERSGWELSGAFHSHPSSPARPSPNDLAGALDPTWLYVIAGMADPADPEVRAYRIRAGAAIEEPIVFVGDRTRR